MSDHDERLRTQKKPQLTDADKALLEAEPDWERMGQAAKRLLSERPSGEIRTAGFDAKNKKGKAP